MKIEHEHEKDVVKDEVEGLKVQLWNTIDEGQVVGELLVWLKEVEDVVCMFQVVTFFCTFIAYIYKLSRATQTLN
jgi:hypothetical protein